MPCSQLSSVLFHLCDSILSFAVLRISQVSLLASTEGGTAPVKINVSISKEVIFLSQSHKVKSDVLYDFFHRMQVVMRDSSLDISSPCYGKCDSSCEIL